MNINKFKLRKTAMFVLGILVATMENAQAGPFSGPTFDPEKIDSGIPGFVGPDGDGKVTPDNFVNPIFEGWATGFENYLPTSGVEAQWLTPQKTLGPVTGDVFDITSLGELNENEIKSGVTPGQITLTFDTPIRNGSGADFVVFENGFEFEEGLFAELAYVEVSTDGINFTRFPSTSLTSEAVEPFGILNSTNIYNLAGKHVNNAGVFEEEIFGSSWGTPFDLENLIESSLVSDGLLNLNEVNYVRIVDIPGNGAFLDGSNSPIYDPYPTPIPGSGGFDLEAVGVINPVAIPEPESGLGFLVFAALGVGYKFTRKQ